MDRALHDAAELPQFAGLVLEPIPPVLPLAPPGEQCAQQQIKWPKANSLTCVTALMGEHLAGQRKARCLSVTPARAVTQAATANLDRQFLRRRRIHLLAQH